ncbi:hypothetical protein HAX54_042083 [Datura stramonium]|uniref:Uncharacterized protein n=1 Tax=Datura stramonium TaxID=4076 RepID=A0ABS8VYG9_DATST|nr:hypothetical protein [Datura stramonium]
MTTPVKSLFDNTNSCDLKKKGQGRVLSWSQVSNLDLGLGSGLGLLSALDLRLWLRSVVWSQVWVKLRFDRGSSYEVGPRSSSVVGSRIGVMSRFNVGNMLGLGLGLGQGSGSM